MTKVLRVCFTVGVAVMISTGRVGARDSALGTFTVGGKTNRFTQIYATLEASPAEANQNYLILLVSDVAIAPADRSPERLLKLASSGTVHAVRLLWKYGTDGIAVVPYHSGIAESGRAFASMSTVNLSALNDTRVDAEFKSKMLGQTWFFNAIAKTAIARGGVATLEPAMEASLPSSPGPGGKSDPTALKRSLGAMAYEYKPDNFFRAIADRKAAAVTMFLQAGMSPNQKDEQGHFALNYAVLFCAQSADESAAVIQALLAGKADVKTKDPQNGTTALVGATQSCSPAAIEALVKAGSDLTAKANSGLTALQLAKIYQRADVVAILQKAGAK
jgi:Ankyrin repeats (3 copies)